MIRNRPYKLPIANLIRDRILTPLGMNSTLVPLRGPDRRAIISGDLQGRLADLPLVSSEGSYVGDDLHLRSPGHEERQQANFALACHSSPNTMPCPQPAYWEDFYV